MSTVEQATYAPEDLLTLPDGEQYELVDGQLVEKDRGAKSDSIALELMRLVANFVKQHSLGHVFGSSTGYQCFPDDPGMARKPDGSFIATGRLPGDEIPEGHIRLAPDLALEVISPNDRYYEVDAKVHLYRDAGIRLIWVVNPDNRTVKVYAQGRDFPVELTVGDTLDGGDVLPGFSIPVAEMFPKPE